MSVIKPEIDNLLDKTENNPFLLCSIASKRACDINNMVRGQHLRVTAIQDFDDITTVVSGKDPVSVAMQEIEEGTPRLRQGGLRRGHQGRQRHLPVGRCMTERLCLVHYHEIGLKGKNRSTFENQLVTNLHRALRDFPVANIARISGYIVVETTDRLATEELAAAIRRVPGVARVSLAYKCGLDEGEYSSAAVRALGEAGDFASFKVHARRSSTHLRRPYPRHEQDRRVGALRGVPRQEGRRPHPRRHGRGSCGPGVDLRLRRVCARRGRPSRRHGGQGRDAALERL